MIRALAALLAAISLHMLGSAVAQPTACSIELHCSSGFYCDPDLLFCRECLSCENLKRESPPSRSSCIKSVSQCGPCKKGLVEDHRGDVNAQCVPQSARSEGDGFPMYGWVLVALLCLLILLVFCAIVWYVLKHPDTLKILASTSTSMQSRCERNVVPATAPENPPPYNALYTPVQANSPTPPSTTTPFNHESDYRPNDEESALPFIKHPSPDRGWAARESAGSQEARIYNNPAYVRRAPIPNGYENGTAQAKGPEVTELDEETMESTWTPSESTNANDNNANTSSAPAVAGSSTATGSTDLPALLAAAKGTALIRTPYSETALQPYSRQDPNNNGNLGNGESSFACGEGTSGAATGHSSSFIINVVQTINTV